MLIVYMNSTNVVFYIVSFSYHFNNVYFTNVLTFLNNLSNWITFYSIIKWQPELSYKLNYWVGTIIFRFIIYNYINAVTVLNLYYINSISYSTQVPPLRKTSELYTKLVISNYYAFQSMFYYIFYLLYYSSLKFIELG